MELPIQDPKARPMRRRSIMFPDALWADVGRFAKSLEERFERRVERSEAVRLLCSAALFAEKSSEKQPKARGSKS